MPRGRKPGSKNAPKTVTVTAKRRKGAIEVGFSRQVDPVKWYEVDQNTPLAVFLAKIEKAYDASLRINGEVKNPEYVLQHEDIINSVEPVAGGRA